MSGLARAAARRPRQHSRCFAGRVMKPGQRPERTVVAPPVQSVQRNTSHNRCPIPARAVRANMQLPVLSQQGEFVETHSMWPERAGRAQLRPPVSAGQSHVMVLISFVSVTNGSRFAIFDMRSGADAPNLVLSRRVSCKNAADILGYGFIGVELRANLHGFVD